eukprot:TRINITY_DN3765_c0_g1_i1.p1 TRINITY_DN3765_c0_g1~~TRINITY_DN3765_c0_g1_i1.p1  ORF type:complete len:431 (+),score=133.11 TRINITY_DN3765_c0_g1_i1:450-1742(+)
MMGIRGDERNDRNETEDDKWVLDSSLVHLNETFEVTVMRNGLGLGFSIIGGGDSEIRIKKIFPLQPAWETGKLRQGDILLKVSGIPLDALNVREALDVLRSSPPATVLTICRPHSSGSNSNPLSSSVTRSYSFTPVNTSSIWEGQPIIIPSPQGPCDKSFLSLNAQEDDESNNNNIAATLGEFTVVLQKVKGSLGFTLKASEDTTVMRHSIKALVKEPALSNKALKPGDKLISANNVDLSKFSHSELVQFLRHCPERVVLRLYRDASRSQTPVTSPDKSPFSYCAENNYSPTHKQSQNKMLRVEAMEMVRSLQASRSSLGDSLGSCSSLSRRKHKGGNNSSLLITPNSSSLPLIESPEPMEDGSGNLSLPPMYIDAQESISRLQIQDISHEPPLEQSPPHSSPPLRPDSLNLSKSSRRQKSYAFHSMNKK